MSSYVNIYVRDNNVFLPIGDFCRSSCMYRALEEKLPYEKLKVVDENLILNVKAELNEQIKRYEKYIENKEHAISLFLTANNSLEEKVIAISEMEQDVADLKEEIADIEYTIGKLEMILCIIDSAYYGVENYVYAGIECCPEYMDEVEIVDEGVVEVFHPSGKRD